MTDRFVAAGMKVVLADVDEVRLRNAHAELTETGADVLPVVVDVSLGESLEELARRTLEKYGAAPSIGAETDLFYHDLCFDQRKNTKVIILLLFFIFDR